MAYTAVMRVIKRNLDGSPVERTIDISPLTEILTPHELFLMEFHLNKLALRFHITVTDTEGDNRNETKEGQQD